MPFLVDTKRYAPGEDHLRADLRARYGSGPFLFSPARQAWNVKGNDKLLRAVAVVARHYPGLQLILPEWGVDLARSRALVSDLGLRVVWIPMVSKPALIRLYNAVDVVLDQFNLGAFGTSTVEAMACAKPVVMDFDDEQGAQCYTELPPLVRAR